MCVTRLSTDQFWSTRNGSIVATVKAPNGKIGAVVVKAKDPKKFPVGTRVNYKSDMGHVLCDGNERDEQDKCKLHPLDAEYNNTNETSLVQAVLALVPSVKAKQKSKPKAKAKPARKLSLAG